MSTARERLGALCNQIARHADIDQAIRDAGAEAQLDELLTAVRTGKAVDQDLVVELLDAIEEACARNGLTGITAVTRYTPLPFQQRGQEEPPTWICPTRSCDRAVFDDEAATPPHCAAAGAQMLPVQILS